MWDSLDKFFEILLYPFIFLSIYFQVFMLYNFLSNKNRMSKEEKFIRDHFPTVTFLLPGWNEGLNIATTIRSIQDLNYPKDKIEIFYLDNNSTDNTKDVVNVFMNGGVIVNPLLSITGKHLNLRQTSQLACSQHPPSNCCGFPSLFFCRPCIFLPYLKYRISTGGKPH